MNPQQISPAGESPSNSRRFTFLGILAAFGLAFNTSIFVLNRDAWGIDFNQFYSAGKLAGSGHLYDWGALSAVERQNGPEGVLSRVPIVAYGFKIFSGVSFRVARAVWLTASLAAFLVFAFIWPGAQRALMLVGLAWSFPATMLLLFGQDVPFWLLFFATGLLLMKKEHPWAAGLAFSLCICKFHLAAGIPVLLAAQKRWRTLVAGGIALLVWIALSFVVDGRNWPLAYVRMTRLPGFELASERTPNLYGLVSWLPSPAAFEIAGAVLIGAVLWAACRSRVDLGMAGAAACACGLLLGHHASAKDCALLIPLSVLTMQRSTNPQWLRGWAAIMLSPAPELLLISRAPMPAQLLIVAFAIAATVLCSGYALPDAGSGTSTPLPAASDTSISTSGSASK